MRLLFLTQTYPRFEGDTAGPFIRDLARGLVLRGHQVSVLTPHAADVPARWDDGGVEVTSFRYAPQGLELIGYSRTLDKDEKMKVGAAVAAPLYVAGARAAIRRQLEQARFDLLHAHWVVPNALVAAPASRRVPLAVGLHGSDVFLAEKAGVRRLVAGALGHACLLTGCSPELVRRVSELGFEGPEFVIPYGVDVEQFSPTGVGPSTWRRDLNIPDEATVALSVGRMVTKKGYQVMLPILAGLMDRFPDFHLILAGGGDRLEEFRRGARDLPRVHFPGVVYRDRLPDLYRSADLFVLPAVHDPQGNVDGLPNVILEAMASGLPVVATAISGIPLAVEDGRQGRLVPEQDAESLRGALEQLLGDVDVRRAMGLAARKKAEGELTWAVVAGRYEAAYEAALSALATSVASA